MYLIDLFMQSGSLENVAVADFSFWSLFVAADWVVKGVMILLVVASIWSWAVAVDKGITIHLLKRHATRFEDTFWSGKTLEELSAGLAGDTRDPMARIFAAAMREFNQNQTKPKNSGLILAQDRIEGVMNMVINREMNKAERGMSVLATVGSISVFIGLFGTVWGIMNTFRAITEMESTNLSVIAPGLSEALFATALGLIAAIPAVVFYNLYTSDLDKYSSRLEGYADELSAILSRKISKEG